MDSIGKAEPSRHVEFPQERTSQNGSIRKEEGLVASEEHPEPVPAQHPVGLYPWIVVGACCVGLWSIAYSLGAAGTWLTQVEAGIGGASIGNWLPFAAQIVQAVIAPPLNLASDMFGRKWIVVWALAMGCVGSIVAGTADRMQVAIGGLAIAGSAFVAQSLLYAIASEVVPHRLRAASQGFLNSGGTGVGGLMANTIAGIFVSHNVGGKGGWRWVFYFQAILFGFSALVFTLVYRPAPTPNPQGRSAMQRIRTIDFIGSGLLAVAVIPFSMGLLWGGNAYKWNSTPVIVTLTIGCVGWIALGVHQTVLKRDGLFNHELFKYSRNFPIACGLIFVEGTIFIIFNIYYPFSTAVLWESRAFLQGLRTAPLFIGFIIASPVWGWWVTRTKTTRAPLILGYSLFLAAFIGLALATPGSQKVAIAYACLVGLGISVPLVLLTVLCHFAIPVELLGLGSSLLLLSRCIGGVVGAAIATAVFNTKSAVEIPAHIASAAMSAGATPEQIPQIIAGVAGNNAAALVGVDPAIIGAAVQGLKLGFARSFSFVWYTGLPFVAVSIIGCFFIEDIKHLMNHHVDRPLDGRTFEEEAV